MGLMQKRDDEDHEYIEGVEIIERSDVPDDLPEDEVELEADAAEDADSGQDADDDDKDPDGDNEDAVRDEATSDDGDDGGTSHITKRRSHTPLIIAIAIVAVVVAAIVGYFVGSGGFTSSDGVGTTTVTEDQLDEVLARYTYDGAEHTVTVREALESQYSLEASQNDDGTYTVPSAEVVLANVRNELMADDAEARGIEVTDEEMEEYAEETLGVSDYDTLAEEYSIDEDQAREIVRVSTLISKLYEQIVPDASSLTAPTQPDAPADGEEDVATEEYADYIIDLLGDEWDSDTGTWATTDGEMYEAIDGENFDGQTATYDQATAAYYVAYEDYYEEASAAQQTWTDYVNGLFANCNLTLYGVYQ